MTCEYSGEENLGEKMWALEGSDDSCSWTVNCLRRRLLAERATSRAAKEDAEITGRKLIELENQLKLETKARNRAEKMLKFSREKLKSLEISNEEVSGNSSTAPQCFLDQDERSSPGKLTEENNAKEIIGMLAGSYSFKGLRCQNSASPGESVNQESFNEQNSSFGDATNSQSNEYRSEEDEIEFKSILSSRESRARVIGFWEMEAMTTHNARQKHTRQRSSSAEEPMDCAENPLAIVSVNMWPESRDQDSQMGRIREVLLALRHAKEYLRSSIGIKGSVQSGSVELCGF